MNMGRMAALAAWACMGLAAAAAAETQVPISAFATGNSMHSPQLSPDGKYLAVSAELGDGRYALRIYRLSDFTMTALLNLPRFEVPTQVRWVSDRRLIIARAASTAAAKHRYRPATSSPPMPMARTRTTYSGTTAVRA